MINFDIDKGILDLQSKIGVSPTFFKQIYDEDDWSFIIKLHALIEAACNHLILYHLQEPKLSKIITRLELSSQVIGKIAFLKSLDLLSKYYRRFIVALSELRNSLVHDVRNSTFSIQEMIGNYAPKELKNFAESFAPWEKTLIELNKKDGALKGTIATELTVDKLIKRTKENPKFHIWLGAHNLLVALIDNYSYSDYKNWLKLRYDSEEIK